MYSMHIAAVFLLRVLLTVNVMLFEVMPVENCGTYPHGSFPKQEEEM